MLDVAPDKNTYKDSVPTAARPKIVPTSRQLFIHHESVLPTVN